MTFTPTALASLVQVYVDGHVPEEEYRRQKKHLEVNLRSPAVPDADAAVTAGKLLENLPALWDKAGESVGAYS